MSKSSPLGDPATYVRLPRDVRRAAERAAEAEGRTLSGWCRHVLTKHLRDAGALSDEGAPVKRGRPLR